VCAAALDQEQADQDDQRNRHDQMLERIAVDIQAFDRGEHGDRRGQHAVAKEQRQTDNGAGPDQGFGAAAQARGAMRQRRQRQGATLAVIVGAHDDHDVFDRHHQDQRPEDHGE
jgi:hypothetical protein